MHFIVLFLLLLSPQHLAKIRFLRKRNLEMESDFVMPDSLRGLHEALQTTRLARARGRGAATCRWSAGCCCHFCYLRPCSSRIVVLGLVLLCKRQRTVMLPSARRALGLQRPP